MFNTTCLQCRLELVGSSLIDDVSLQFISTTTTHNLRGVCCSFRLLRYHRGRFIAPVGFVSTIRDPNLCFTTEFLTPRGELNHHLEKEQIILPSLSTLPISGLYQCLSFISEPTGILGMKFYINNGNTKYSGVTWQFL